MMFDRMVPLNSTGSCGTYMSSRPHGSTMLMTLRTKSPVRSLMLIPSRSTSPEFTLYSPPSSDEIVLFPLPDPPTIPMFSPGCATRPDYHPVDPLLLISWSTK